MRIIVLTSDARRYKRQHLSISGDCGFQGTRCQICRKI